MQGSLDITASSHGLTCKMFCKICHCKNFAIFLQNFCKNFCTICCKIFTKNFFQFFCTIFAKFLQIVLGFGHEVPIFWLMLFSRRGCRMRDWRPLLLFFFCKNFCKFFAKNLQNILQSICKKCEKKFSSV